MYKSAKEIADQIGWDKVKLKDFFQNTNERCFNALENAGEYYDGTWAYYDEERDVVDIADCSSSGMAYNEDTIGLDEFLDIVATCEEL